MWSGLGDFLPDVVDTMTVEEPYWMTVSPTTLVSEREREEEREREGGIRRGRGRGREVSGIFYKLRREKTYPNA